MKHWQLKSVHYDNLYLILNLALVKELNGHYALESKGHGCILIYETLAVEISAL